MAPSKQKQDVIRVREYDEDPLKDRDNSTIVTENYHEYIVDVSGSPANGAPCVVGVLPLASNRRRRWIRAPIRVMQELFLPIGFPSSVNEGYLQYQLYDSLQGLCSYLRGVLCSAQVLQAAGVGKAEATALSAAMTWALKDGVSMIGGLFFSYTAAHLFDSHVKEFRLFADIINDAGLTLDMLAPYFENNLLMVASAAGLCKALCGLSAGATKSSITQHFALEGNMADLNAKESTQETLVSLVGMLLGVALAQKLRNLEEAGHESERIIHMQWLVFGALTILHVWANWKGVQLLRMRTLNRERAHVALKHVLAELIELEQRGAGLDYTELLDTARNVPPPTVVYESLLSSTYHMLWPGRLKLMATMTEILQADLFTIDEFQRERYFLAIDPQNRVLVCLLTGAQSQDQLKAFLHALYVTSCLQSSHAKTIDARRFLVSRTHKRLNVLFDRETVASKYTVDLLGILQSKGWEVEERLYVGFPRRRSQFSYDKDE